MSSLILVLTLSVVVALASFLAGALPISMSLSHSQLRLISSVGIGILVGTCLIVIIPEGIETVAATSACAKPHVHGARSMDTGSTWHSRRGVEGGLVPELDGKLGWSYASHRLDVDVENSAREDEASAVDVSEPPDPQPLPEQPPQSELEHPPQREPDDDQDNQEHDEDQDEDQEHQTQLPTFEIGFSLVTGFILMFLIDRLPMHATSQFQSAPATRHISLDNLSSTLESDDDSPGNHSFLGSLAPSPRQSRSLATTMGLVIHAAADGIALGASATTQNMKLGFIIFAAIIIHKAPAAFGLTSVLLKQGLSKRAARGHLVVFSLAAPVGAVTTYVLITVLSGGKLEGDSRSWWTGMLLLFSAGTFLYVAMHAMNEENHKNHNHHRDSVLGSGGNGSANGNGSYSESGIMMSNGISGQGRRSNGKPGIRDTLLTIAGMLVPLLTQFGHHN